MSVKKTVKIILLLLDLALFIYLIVNSFPVFIILVMPCIKPARTGHYFKRKEVYLFMTFIIGRSTEVLMRQVLYTLFP
jgi:hypothetical protein